MYAPAEVMAVSPRLTTTRTPGIATEEGQCMSNDEEKIRRTLAEYCQHLDNRHFEEYAGTFTEDGVLDIHDGRAAILSWIKEGALATRPELRRKHATTNLVIDVTGDTAHVQSDCVMFDAIGDGPWAIMNQWRFDDQMQRVGDRWLIKSRKFIRDLGGVK
ncbi:MAG: nuclear transport factor 2 family protein [Dehalococcoidia bacterium]|nr:nuclear transport factor 2 family protein [Dehalococcoidia bacterium]